ncbi:MAG: DUF1127 domain-containing protein [Rhodobacteraceae bacterium]|nr:DUF1127 domain-containing protein [Paracoccaceae bacterium]
MAAFDTTRPQYAATDFVGRIGQVFATAIGAFSAWNDARATRNSLSKLTDRELDDIGLVRGDIDAVANAR